MRSLVIRALEPRDDEGFRHVRAMAYRNGEPVKPEDRLLRDDCLAYIGELDGEVVAATTVIDMTATKGARDLRCGGLAAVGVIPEKRRTGIGSALMSEVLPLLDKEGFVLCSLYPFRGTYYRKFGYEFCGQRLGISCPSHRLPKIFSPLEARLIPYAKREDIYACYRNFARNYAGMNDRKEDQWWRVLGADTPMQIYAVGDPVEGYIVLRLNSDFWNNQTIKEIAWTTQRGYDSLISYFGSLAINKTIVEWREPSDGPFYSLYSDQGIACSFDNNIMFRLINVKKALEALQPDGDGQFCFSCADPNVSANSGPWTVTFSGGKTAVERGGQAGFEIPIGALTQAFLGQPSFESILRYDKVSVSRACDIEAASKLFMPQTVYCAEFF